MRRAMIGAVAMLMGATPAAAELPYNGLPPITADAKAMASARAVVGSTCRFLKNDIGPQPKGWRNLDGVGQMLAADDDFVFVRGQGAQRVAFLAHDPSGGRCVILDVQPLPPRLTREAFLDCEVQDPDPFKNEPLSHGLGLRQGGRRALAAYLEVRGGKLIPRDGSDRRIRCTPFESGD